jgi:hypothetical protein
MLVRSCFWARLEFNERMEKAFMDSKGIFIASLTGVLIVALSIGGCEKKEQAPPPAPQAQQPAPAPAPQAQAPAPVPAPEAAAPAAPPAPQATQAKPVLASSDGEKPGSRVEIQEFKRASGGTVMLRFALINDADQTLNVGYDFGSGSTTDIGTVGGVHLIEPVGKKKYLVIRDSENKCDCSRGVKDVAAKSRVNLWARFPAPPDNVEKIGVVIPHFSPMDDVPLGR